MNKPLLVFALILATTLVSCKKKLTACIEMESTTFSVGQEVTFTSCSENVISYDWRISGPSSAPENMKGWSDRIITNSFSVPGSYTITLSTFDDFSLMGNKETESKTFTIN